MDGEFQNIWQFGDLRLDTARKVLWHHDKTVPMPLKELELLSMLVRNHGELVTKNEILEEIWENSFVEESNLSRHIYLLRKTLKELGSGDLIENVPRRGYRFTGDASVFDAAALVIEHHTRTRTTIEIADGGPQALKSRAAFGRRSLYKVAGTMLAIVVAVTAVGIWRSSVQSAEPALPKVRSIAVLPLKSFSEVDDELRLRIADALITKLGNSGGVSVSPTNSILRFVRQETDAVEAGRKLEVDAVLDGRIQAEGKQLRVTLQLISTATGEQMWSSQFDGRVDEILKLQDTIAASLLPRLGGGTFLARNPTANTEAYENYLKGRYLWNKRQTGELKKAVAYFEQAIALDANFALAYAGLADAYSQLANDGPAPDIAGYAKSKAMANKALEIDPGLSEGYSALGWIAYIYDWNWPEAERVLTRAIELNPNNAEAHHWRALNFRATGKTEEYFAEMETARALAPLTKPIARNYYDVVKNKEGCEKAFEYLETLFALHEVPENERGELLGMHHTLCGSYEDAISILEKMPEETRGIKTRAFLGVAYAKVGRRQQALEVVTGLGNVDSTVRFYLRPYVHVALGDFESAFADLEKGIAARDNRFARLPADDFLAPLRSDVRFKRLLGSMNLTQ